MRRQPEDWEFEEPGEPWLPVFSVIVDSDGCIEAFDQFSRPIQILCGEGRERYEVLRNIAPEATWHIALGAEEALR